MHHKCAEEQKDAWVLKPNSETSLFSFTCDWQSYLTPFTHLQKGDGDYHRLWKEEGLQNEKSKSVFFSYYYIQINTHYVISSFRISKVHKHSVRSVLLPLSSPHDKGTIFFFWWILCFFFPRLHSNRWWGTFTCIRYCCLGSRTQAW